MRALIPLSAGTLLLALLGACAKSESSAPAIPEAWATVTDQPSKSAAFNAELAARTSVLARDPSSLEARGKLAVFLHANDELAAAATLYEQVRIADPKEARWSYFLARIEQDEGRTERALTLMEEVTQRAPEFALAHLRRGDLALKLGNSSLAESAYHTFLTREPDSVHARLGLARLAMQREEWSAAEALLLDAARAGPTFPTPRALLVSVYEASGDSAKADRARQHVGTTTRYREPEDLWLESLVEECVDVEKLSVLADGAVEAGRVPRAIALLHRSLKLDPTRGRTHLELAKVQLKVGDREAAFRSLAEAIRLDPQLADAHYALAGERYAAGDTANALAAAELGVRHHPRDSGLRRQLGVVLQAMQRDQEAESALRVAVDLDRSEVRNVEALGNFLWARRRKPEAVVQLERARALSPLAVKSRAMLAGYYLETGDMALAERCLHEASEVEPTLEGLNDLRALFHVRRGNELYRSGNVAAAETSFRTALAAVPVHEEALTNLIAVWLRTQRDSEARALLERFTTEHPNAAFGYSLAARVAAQTGDFATARTFVTRGLSVAVAQRDTRQEQALRSLQSRLPP